ncbi:16S rRNA (cytosine967-C5)-methyltransferase [Monaibacterium marinum]|uniref:16S rRNA (Cytosine967-C5)-methyltransferase n=1 Tax=Pontivivens marinum TaxID=1690039 RepID=A0A2C9CT48_9RHOB|nr:RsmB/NOP family class I SAM-dependent RNA methyltransferase [Monaibacterium marinum]SOH93549.1 16S rRNA (cytosine967-C5)-methyltransferase [Monaibacterium marinum]
MVPAARYAAAIEVLDRITAGARAPIALRDWGRSNRFAGSGDRRAIGDIVHDVLRHWWSSAQAGGAETGRGRVLGLLRLTDVDPETVFTGVGHAPAVLDEAERDFPVADASDVPDFVEPMLRARFSEDFSNLIDAMRSRAPLDLRANLLKADRDQARAALAADGIDVEDVALSTTALRAPTGDRRIVRSAAYLDGLVELQDASSQAVVDFAQPKRGERILDYCTGAGGKALPLAARAAGPVDVHDIAPARMRDLPERAARAGVTLRALSTDALAGKHWDLVFADAPCSGSGSWRRDPEGKIRLTPQSLADVQSAQTDVLDACAPLVAPGGRLIYATCSLLPAENEEAVAAFLLRTSGWKLLRNVSLTPLDGGDGFFAAWLEHA